MTFAVKEVVRCRRRPAGGPGPDGGRGLGEDTALADIEAFAPDNPAVVGMSFGALLDDGTIDAFAKAQCPILVPLATKNVEQARDFDESMAAGRRGVERDLTTAAAANPNLTVAKVDGTHGMLATQPAAITDIARQFLPPSRKEH